MRAVHFALLFIVLLAEGWMLNDIWNKGSMAWESTLSFAIALVGFTFSEYWYPASKETPAPQVAQADVDLFNEFQKALPYDPTILTIKNHDFGGSYRTTYLDPLFSFVSTWGDVHKEFVNAELEAEKKKVYEAARTLATEVARHTTPEGAEGHFSSVFPESLRGGPRPEHVRESARILNQLSRQFMPVYEGFVRLAKTKLAMPKA